MTTQLDRIAVIGQRPHGLAPYEPGPWARRGDRFLAHALSESLNGRDPLPAISAARAAFLIDLGELAPDVGLRHWAAELPEPDRA